MKKRSATIAIIAIAVLALCSCSKPGKPSAARSVTVTILDYQDATSPGYAANVALWEKFQKDNPDITIVKEELFNEPFHE